MSAAKIFTIWIEMWVSRRHLKGLNLWWRKCGRSEIAERVNWSTIVEDLWFYLVAFVKEVKGRSKKMKGKVMGTARVHWASERVAKSHRPINKTKGNEQEKPVFGLISALYCGLLKALAVSNENTSKWWLNLDKSNKSQVALVKPVGLLAPKKIKTRVSTKLRLFL